MNSSTRASLTPTSSFQIARTNFIDGSFDRVRAR
jgi:hypothetical protein